MRPGIIVGIALAILSLPVFGQQRDLFVTPDPGPRVALLIGNDDYQHVPKLRNAANDARDLGARLQEVGFDVQVVTNADLRTMNQAVDRFVASLQPGAVAFFHFSGHGMQIDGENFLIPVDFRVTDEASVRYDAESASKIHDRMVASPSRLNIVVLDACRNNGFRGTRSMGGGLAAMNAAEGTFIAFATSPGSTADDNPGSSNGLFTSYLIDDIARPGWTLDQVFNDVRRRVYQASEKHQLPWTSSSVIGDFYFRRPDQPLAPKPAPDSELTVELTYWDSVKDSGDAMMLNSYLSRYPKGRFADLAHLKVARLSAPGGGSAPTPKAASVPPPQQQPVSQPVAALQPPVEVARVEPTAPGPRQPEARSGAQTPEVGSVRFNPADRLPYIWVPGPGTAPASGFWMTRTEVTVEAYRRFAQADGVSLPSAPAFNNDWKEPTKPIVSVTWEEAAHYCRYAGGRLPTESEWEDVARRGSSGADTDAVAWHDNNSGNRPHDVASKQPDSFGLFDLLGNVSEWCASDDPAEALNRGRQSYVARGGSWRTRKKDLTPARREELLGGMRNTDVGFRCVIPQ